ncbi:MAG: DNA mismatch repair endonuclease MutL [Ruminiclostridium sp.]|nr:DNA mismatch repair endonuclease MutL [Ruminiclostridium sp.]
MAKINLLDKSVFELIAAGEVIERPASVIKELVENSIDAGAKHITVEIKNGGSTFMRITDDGCGIAYDEIPTAFLRHATSKVKSAKDLDRIFTLGFRGEALASVAAVSRVEVLTKEQDSEMGSSFRISGGEIEEHERTGCPDGTTIVIRDLFYNVPARQKFLKKDVTEGNQIQSLVDRLALAHPEIAFRFIRDNKTVRDTSGGGDYYSAIYSVFGKQFAMSLIPVDFTLNGVSVTGYVSSPLFTRGNRSLQYFYVNSRNVKSLVLMTALEEGFRNSIMVGKFPACVLNITMPPELCDVNVSPSKTEVRFAFDKNVFDAVNFGVRNAIMNADSKRDVKLEKKEIPAEPADMRSGDRILLDKAVKAIDSAVPTFGGSEQSPERHEPPEEPPRIFKIEEKPVYTQAQVALLRVKHEESPFVQQHFATQKVTVEYDEEPDDEPAEPEETAGSAESIAAENTFRYISSASFSESKTVNAAEAQEISAAPVKPRLKVIGEVFGTYIVCTSGDQLIMIDKHAAHERINFEKRRNELITSSQLLAESVRVTLSAEQYAAVWEHTDLLADIGMDVILTDGNICEITAAPSAFTGGAGAHDPAEMLIRAADCMAAGDMNITAEIYGDFQHTRACKSAIKAHDNNTREELEALAEEVWKDDRIRFCPHGRPIMLKLSEYELEKYFSRIQ